MTIPEYPITREEMYLDAIARGGGGGGGVTVTPLSATENGTYTAPSGTAYSPVTVDVPGPDPSVQLVAEGDFVAPVATSSNQTIEVSLDSTLVGLAPNVPFLAVLEYTGQYPTAPEKIVSVKAYQLFSLYSNYQWYIYNAGAWGVVIKPDGTISYSQEVYSSERNAVNTLCVGNVQDTKCHITCKASNDNYGYQPGNWHLKLFALQM